MYCWLGVRKSMRPVKTKISCRWQTLGMRCITANMLKIHLWTLSVTNLRPSWDSNASRRKSPIFSYRTCISPPAFGASAGGWPFEFCRDFRHQKTRLLALSSGVVCVVLDSAVSVEHRLMSVGQTRQTYTWAQTDTHITTANTRAHSSRAGNEWWGVRFRFRFIRIVARRLKITKFTSNKKH